MSDTNWKFYVGIGLLGVLVLIIGNTIANSIFVNMLERTSEKADEEARAIEIAERQIPTTNNLT